MIKTVDDEVTKETIRCTADARKTRWHAGDDHRAELAAT